MSTTEEANRAVNWVCPIPKGNPMKSLHILAAGAAATVILLSGCASQSTSAGSSSGGAASSQSTEASQTSSSSESASSPAASPSASGSPSSSSDAATKVNANSASAEELKQALEGAGVANPEKIADEIIEYRPYTAENLKSKLSEELAKYGVDETQLVLIVSVLEV